MRRGSRDLSIEDRIVFCDNALELRKKRKWGYRRIARELNLKETTVKNWLRGHRPETHWVFPHLNLSEELSYILGVYYGDGSIHRATNSGMYRNCDAYRIQLGAVDKEFVEKFNQCLSQILCRENEYPVHGPYKNGTCRLMGTNRKLFEFLDKPLKEHKSIIENRPAPFLRGFFDSEGSVCEYIGNKGKYRSWYQSASVSNTNLPLLQYVHDILVHYYSISSSIGLSGRAGETHIVNGYRGVSRTKNCYKLTIGKRKSIIIFYQRIGFTIKRKQMKLAKIVRRINSQKSIPL